MKIALINSRQPFIYGGAEILVDNLMSELKSRGHSVKLYDFPFQPTVDNQFLNTICSARSVMLHGYDKVIAFKFPSYYIRHPNKTLWIFHQYRQVYDLWNTEFGLMNNSYNRSISGIVRNADSNFISDAKNIFVIANEVGKRLKEYNGIESNVLYPPLEKCQTYYCEDYGDYIFYPSRINRLKRQLLAVESMKYTRTKVKLVIAGTFEDRAYQNEIMRMVSKHNLSSKVVIYDWVDHNRKCALMASSLACVFIPYKEDYGLVTLEASYSKKSVITLKDSGGVREFIEDGNNGFVLDPDPKQMAIKYDELYNNRDVAKRMGIAAYEKINSMNINWDETIKRLLF